MADDGIRVEHHDYVAELVLDRPARLNAISTALARAVAEAAGAIAADSGVRAVVVSSSSERAFCVGADLKERNSFTDADLMRQRRWMRACFGGVLALPVPSIAAVHGHALGGGLELALSCDLIVADETAVVGLPEVTVGVVPGGGGTQLLARRIGYTHAADVIFTGRHLDIDDAERLGIVNRRVPAGADRAEALALARRIADNSPVSVRNAKNALRRGLDVDLAAGLDIEDAAWRAAVVSDDRREGIAAFNEKRRPSWPGDGA